MKLINCGLLNRIWRTDYLDVFSQNLIVGKNSVGKSTIIRHLSHMASLISQRRLFDVNEDIAYMISIKDRDYLVTYRFAWRDSRVFDEYLAVKYGNEEEKVRIARTPEEARFNGEVVNPPKDKLLINMKRDTVLYPELETIISWAENVDALSFNEFDIDGDERLFSRFIKGGNNLYTMVRALNQQSIDNVIQAAERMDYHLDKIEAVEYADIHKVVFVEKGVTLPLFDFNLSKGMFRTLYLLIYLEYIAKSGKPVTLLIDDLCQGLDYDRSTKLGKYVFDYCSKNDIQLIATSNDSFLMDVVDLNYWSILQREGSKVSAINQKTHQDLFEDFSFTGLSNFDLLSSDFIARHNKNK